MARHSPVGSRTSPFGRFRDLDRVDQAGCLLTLLAFYLPLAMPVHVVVNHLVHTTWSWWAVFVKPEFLLLVASGSLMGSTPAGRSLMRSAWADDAGFRWALGLAAAIVAWTTASAIVQGAYPGYWVRGVLVGWALPAVFGLLALALRNRGWLRPIWIALAAGSAVLAAAAVVLYGVSFGVPTSFAELAFANRALADHQGLRAGVYLGRLTLGGFDDIAGYCAICFGMLAAATYGMRAWTSRWRAAAAAFALLLLVLSYLTYSRGSILSMAALAAVAAWPAVRQRRWLPRELVVLAALLAILVACALLPRGALPYWTGQLPAATSATGVSAAPTTRETFAELATSGRLLFGHGPGNFGLAMGATYDAGTRNLFIDAIVDAGVPAGLLFGLFWLVALCRAWRYLAEAGTAGGPPATHDVPAHLPWLALVSMTVVGVLVGLRLDHLGTMLHASVLWLAIASTARPAVAAAEPRAVGPTLADRGFRFTPRSRPSWLVACLQVGTGLVVAWALGAFSLFKPMVAPSGTDMHADVSLELAVNRALCGRTSHLGHTSIAEALRRRPDLLKLPVLEVPAAVAGSTAEYCASVNRPFLNNENGMTFLLAAALRLRPGLTLAALGNAMRVFRMACWAVFLLAAARAGAPWLFLVVAWYLALRVNAGVELTHPYSVYPYFAPLLFGYAGLLALMVAACRGRGMSRSLLALFVAGALTGLAASVRSSHLPVYACMTLAAACFIVPLRLRPPVRASLARTAALLLAWAAGWMAFQRTFIAPIESLPTTSNRSYHVVAHPLVLALAVPPNPLAEREGIQWSDLVGIDLARRVDPSATYLGPTYERALFTYYGSLWNRFPLEMLGVYAKKWALAGTNVRLANERPVIERVFQLLLLPYTAIRHGGVLMAVLAGLALVAGTRVRWNPEARALPVFVLLVALLLLVECTIILPDFRLVYHAPLLMVMVLVVWLAVCLAVVELVAWIVRSSQRAPAGGRRVTPVNLSPSADGAAGDVTS